MYNPRIRDHCSKPVADSLLAATGSEGREDLGNETAKDVLSQYSGADLKVAPH